MNSWIAGITAGGSIFTVGTVIILLGFSFKLIQRIYQGERRKIDSAIQNHKIEMKDLALSIGVLEDMADEHKQSIAILNERDERRSEEQTGLKTRINILDDRLGALSRDMHIGLSEIKTLIIQQGKR